MVSGNAINYALSPGRIIAHHSADGGTVAGCRVRGKMQTVLNVGIPPEFLQMAPYILTMIILAGAIGRAIPPKAAGKPYEKQ